MMGLEEIVAANKKASAASVKRDVAQDLYFAVVALERIAGAVNVEAARDLAAGAIQVIATSRGAAAGTELEPLEDAA